MQSVHYLFNNALMLHTLPERKVDTEYTLLQNYCFLFVFGDQGNCKQQGNDDDDMAGIFT